MVKSEAEGAASSSNASLKMESSDVNSQEFPVYPAHKAEKLRYLKICKMNENLFWRLKKRFKNLAYFAMERSMHRDEFEVEVR